MGAGADVPISLTLFCPTFLISHAIATFPSTCSTCCLSDRTTRGTGNGTGCGNLYASSTSTDAVRGAGDTCCTTRDTSGRDTDASVTPRGSDITPPGPNHICSRCGGKYCLLIS